jgi:hypothetical protein
MHHRTEDEIAPAYTEPPSWGVAAAVAVTIVICIATFVWIYVRLEPFMNDFISAEAIATPTVVATGTAEP